MPVRKESQLSRRIHLKHVQVRDTNKAEGRLLENRLRQLRLGERKSVEAIDLQKKLIEREERERVVINEDTAARVRVAQDATSSGATDTLVQDTISSLRPCMLNIFTDLKRRDPLPSDSLQSASTQTWRSKSVCCDPPCRYNTSRQSCRDFPCNAHKAYTQLAFDVKTDTDQTKPMTYNTATTKRMRQQESLILEMEATSVRRRMQTTRDQTSHKIVALKEIIEQMKRRSEENKPKDWYINYGKPISKRKLIKVARPTSRGVMI